MFDIGAMSQKYGLNPEQTRAVENRFQSLPDASKAAFGLADFEALLGNETFTAGAAEGHMERPTLDSPRQGDHFVTLGAYDGSATPGAAVMAILSKGAAEQRQINKEVRAAQSEATAKLIESQADDMRDKALVQLALSILAGAISIVSGAVAAGKSGNAMLTKLDSGQATLLNTKIGAEQQTYQGMGTLVNAYSQFVGSLYDTDIKKMDAEIERTRASSESLKDINEALTDLIRKCLSAAEAIEESANQARSKILA
jgi:hypothetical protein